MDLGSSGRCGERLRSGDSGAGCGQRAGAQPRPHRSIGPQGPCPPRDTHRAPGPGSAAGHAGSLPSCAVGNAQRSLAVTWPHFAAKALSPPASPVAAAAPGVLAGVGGFCPNTAGMLWVCIPGDGDTEGAPRGVPGEPTRPTHHLLKVDEVLGHRAVALVDECHVCEGGLGIRLGLLVPGVGWVSPKGSLPPTQPIPSLTPQAKTPTFEQEGHEGDDGGAQLGDGQAIDPVVPRRVLGTERDLSAGQAGDTVAPLGPCSFWEPQQTGVTLCHKTPPSLPSAPPNPPGRGI